MTKKERREEFIKNRISWRYFKEKKKFDLDNYDSEGPIIEILKELQYMNDQKD